MYAMLDMHIHVDKIIFDVPYLSWFFYYACYNKLQYVARV